MLIYLPIDFKYMTAWCFTSRQGGDVCSHLLYLAVGYHSGPAIYIYIYIIHIYIYMYNVYIHRYIYIYIRVYIYVYIYVYVYTYVYIYIHMYIYILRHYQIEYFPVFGDRRLCG